MEQLMIGVVAATVSIISFVALMCMWSDLGSSKKHLAKIVKLIEEENNEKRTK